MNNKDFNPFIVNCPSCGSAAEDFDIVRQEYKCRHCGSSVSAHDAKLRFDEWAHGHAEETARTVAKTNAGGKFFCPNCGAEANIASHAHDELVQVKCEYCETRFVAAPPGKTFTSPDTMIPFFITLDEAKMRLRDWCEKKSRRQEAQIALEHIDELRGMYLPYEVVKGPIRFDVFRDQSDRGYTCGGYLDGTAVSVSKNQHNLTLDAMEPFDWSGARAYDAGLITGQTVKLRDTDTEEADSRVKEEVAAAYRLRTEKVMKTKGLSIESEDGGQDWIRASALLPAYVLDCTDASGRTVHFAVNGQTGRVAVESIKPREIGRFRYVLPTLMTIAAAVIAWFLSDEIGGQAVYRPMLTPTNLWFLPEEIWQAAVLTVIFVVLLFIAGVFNIVERRSIDYAISGEQVKAKRSGTQLVVEKAQLPPATAAPVFFEKVHGKEKPVKISFLTFFQIIQIALSALAIMFLPYIIAFPFALFRGIYSVDWESGGLWIGLTGLIVLALLIRSLRNWSFDDPVVREITAGGKTRRIKRGDLDGGGYASFFRLIFNFWHMGGMFLFSLVLLIALIATVYLMFSVNYDSDTVPDTAFVSMSGITDIAAEEDIEKLYALAESGDATAQFNLGNAYYNGWGVKRSSKNAVEWYLKAAEQGHMTAQYNLGAMCRNEGDRELLYDAVKWFLKAAEQGHVGAQYNLGTLGGDGGLDHKDAAEWCLKAAEQGHAGAQRNLAVKYYYGYAVDEDIFTAYMWMSVAAITNPGDKKTMGQLGLFRKKLSAEQIKDAESMAKAKYDEITRRIEDETAVWYLKAAEQGDADAQYNLGTMYYNGEGVEQDYAKAAQWYLKAAEQGHADAQYNLGFMYDDGIGVEQDYAKAAVWYLKAAEQGDADAQYNLGTMYDGVEQDYAKAIEWYMKAAEQGHAGAQYNLGFMYYYGEGVEQDYAKAAQWYLKAAEQGDADAQYNLGTMYYNGDGVEQDYAKAVEWYMKAAEQGHADAQYNLGTMYYNGDGVEKDIFTAYMWMSVAAIAEPGNENRNKALGTVRGKLSAEQIKDAESRAKAKYEEIINN